jgi:hypothetical protein
LSFGNCVDEPLSGDPIGAPCDPTAEASSCLGASCVSVGEGFGMCSAPCRTGTIGCGSGNQMPDDPGEPMCVPIGGVGVEGDYGACIQRCNCDLDCLHPDAKCLAGPEADDEAAIAEFGAIGICFNGALVDDPGITGRLGIECEDDDREPPTMSDSGVDGGGGSPSTAPDSGPMMSLPDSGPPSEPEPVPAEDAAALGDGG